MTESEQDPSTGVEPADVNPGYASLQIAKALATSEEHEDPVTRERAKEKLRRWVTVLRNILTGAVEYGSRTPVEGVPEWATLQVVTGGFATGELLASGPLQEHERRLLEDLPKVTEGDERRALNAHFLTDAGLAQLRDALRTGCYDVAVPEEGALMVVAWLVENGHVEEARGLLDQISPYSQRLRFYPIPLERPRRFGSRVHLQDVGSTLDNLRGIRPNKRILAQRESVTIWAPFYDRIVALFLETVENGWPCQKYPNGWPDRALALLGEYAEVRKEHAFGGKLERANQHYAQLREFLGRCARKPNVLTGREVGRIRLILNRYLEKHGAPDSAACAEGRRRQAADVSAPTFHAIAGVVVPRLERHSRDDGLDDGNHLKEAVTKEEAASTGIPEGTSVPPSIQRKVERCINDTVKALVERGLITSGETLARVLPQMISGLRAAVIIEPELRQLYAAIYRAFRRRRSILLLNLKKQVQIEKLPWVAAIDRFRSPSLSSRELARKTLEDVTVLTLTSFPHMILPNKLLQELRALVAGAELDIPLVDEVAADIFMGAFSGKFVESVKRAAELLEGTLYATYYGINYSEIRNIPKVTESAFVQLCASRADVPLGTWDPATNGMIIEQQQILTTQNLAALFAGLGLTDLLRGQLREMAQQCFKWVCQRQQMKVRQWHARLLMLKNTAYAWRQMVFFLALAPGPHVADFLRWAENHLNGQSEDFRTRFRPALTGLMQAAAGCDVDFARNPDTRRFLGWSNTRHWLLTGVQDQESNC